jgi:PAS domain S-box-containing protein
MAQRLTAFEPLEHSALLRLLGQAVDCVEEGILITDNQLDTPGPTIVFANRGFERMTGYKAAEVLGKTPRILQGPRTERAVLDRLNADLRERGRFSGETYNYRKDGSEFRIHWSIWPILDSEGAVTHYVAIQRDVTPGRRLSDEFRRRLEEEEHAEEQARRINAQLAHIARLNTLGEMAGRLAHELNQPLTAITNYAQGCANRLENNQIEQPELHAVLKLIRDAALRAGEIVDRLRSFVRRKGPHQTAVSIRTLVDRVLGLIEPEVRHSSVQVEIDLPDDLPAVLADDLQLEQVFLNLIRNALESMAEAPFEDRALRITGKLNNDREIEVSVCNRGAGIGPDVSGRMFEPFYSTKAHGLGMGLPISRSIIEWHGGKLWSENDSDRETCFHVILPAIQGEVSNGNGK